VDSRRTNLEREVRVLSRLNPVPVSFHEYDQDPMVQILEARAIRAFRTGAWDRSLLERVAQLSKGAARVALHMFQRAAYRKEQPLRVLPEARISSRSCGQSISRRPSGFL